MNPHEISKSLKKNLGVNAGLTMIRHDHCDRCRSQRDEAARRTVSFQDDHASGPGQAISATTWPNQNLSELHGKNRPHWTARGIAALNR
jgi:hypothetical protein